MRHKPSVAGVLAVVALVLALGGSAYAASTYIITSQTQIKPSVLKFLQKDDTDKGPRGKQGKPGTNGANGANGQIGPQGVAGANGVNGVAGAKGDTGATGATGPRGYPGPRGFTGFTGAHGVKGDTGATGPVGPSELESSRLCVPSLCIDADPNSGGSGGWGWDNVANAAVTDLTVGDTYPFTVTVVQDGAENADGSITLTWNPTDFTGPTSGSDGTCTTASTGNALSCTYTDLAHQYKSVGFNFTALNDNPDAQVVATVQVDGSEASATFPVAITG